MGTRLPSIEDQGTPGAEPAAVNETLRLEGKRGPDTSLQAPREATRSLSRDQMFECLGVAIETGKAASIRARTVVVVHDSHPSPRLDPRNSCAAMRAAAALLVDVR